MKIAIMQPYFFPYIGQFQLIHAADRFILCDDVQYIRHGWINRNRILKAGSGFQYIVVPLSRHASKAPIRAIEISPGCDWKKKILGQVSHYKRTAPHYRQVLELLRDCLSTAETGIARLNGYCLKAVCDYLGIDFTIEISSTLGLDYSGITATDEWALRMSEQLGATKYLNPPGGINLYDKDKFAKSNISLGFINPRLTAYQQFRENFEPGLSVIDVMMFNSPADIRDMLNDYELL